MLLIRDPREVLASYMKTRATVTHEDIGPPQHVQLYDELRGRGEPPPVIDAGDFLRDPATCAPRATTWAWRSPTAC